MSELDAFAAALRRAWQSNRAAMREHNAALLHPIDASPGFFKVRLRVDGAYIPARLWSEPQLDEAGERIADDRYLAELGVDLVDAFNPPMWGGWEPIAESVWAHMRADLVWCLQHDPTKPIANPRQPKGRAPREFF